MCGVESLSDTWVRTFGLRLVHTEYGVQFGTSEQAPTQPNIRALAASLGRSTKWFFDRTNALRNEETKGLQGPKTPLPGKKTLLP